MFEDLHDLSRSDLLASQRRVKAEAWRRGLLSMFKFDERPWALKFYEFFRQHEGDTCWLLAHRRSGKSTAALIVGLEECLRVPYTKVAVVCKAKDQARTICEESFKALLADCPKELRPRPIKNDFKYVFKNHSEISIFPADGTHGSKIRGRRFKLIIVTEAGHIPRL